MTTDQKNTRDRLATNDVKHGGEAMALLHSECLDAIRALCDVVAAERANPSGDSDEIIAECHADMRDLCTTTIIAGDAFLLWERMLTHCDMNYAHCDAITGHLLELRIDGAAEEKQATLMMVAAALRTGDYSALSLIAPHDESH